MSSCGQDCDVSFYFPLFTEYKSQRPQACLCSLGPPSVPTLSCIDLIEDVSGAVNVTVRWTLSGGDSADFYLINITTNAPQTPYGGLLNITIASVTRHVLMGFMEDYKYNITVHGVNCGSQEGRESEPLTIRTQGVYSYGHCMINIRNSL